MKNDIFDNELRFRMTPERRLIKIISTLRKEIDEYDSNTVFYLDSNRRIMMVYYEGDSVLVVNYSLVWIIFENEFSLNQRLIKKLMKLVVEKELGLVDIDAHEAIF